MVLRFTWRNRRHDHSQSQATQARLIRMEGATERKERWSMNRKAVSIAGSSAVTSKEQQESELGYVDEPIETQDVAASTEWGATVNPDGTRSYLNGW